MNYTLQLHSNNRTYPVPRGLHDLMADIAREVLRHKPNNIEKFIYMYVDSLMKIRRVGKGLATEVDSTINEGYKRKLMLQDLGITVEQADKAATKMQATVRGFFARKEYKDLMRKKSKQLNCILLKKQLNNFAVKKKVSRLDISQKTNEIMRRYKLTPAQANTVCTKIQAFYRGWSVRKRKLSDIPSHESWRHDWLWKEFKMSPEEVQAVTHEEKKPHHKGQELIFQPRRLIEVDHIKFMKAFKGELADYDDKTTESSSSSDLSDEDGTDDVLSKRSSEVESREGQEDKIKKIAKKKPGVEISHSASDKTEVSYSKMHKEEEEEVDLSTKHGKENVSEEQLQGEFSHFTEEESHSEHGQENVSEGKVDDTTDEELEHLRESIDSVEDRQESINLAELLTDDLEPGNIDERRDDSPQDDEVELNEIIGNDDEIKPDESTKEEQEPAFEE